MGAGHNHADSGHGTPGHNHAAGANARPTELMPPPLPMPVIAPMTAL